MHITSNAARFMVLDAGRDDLVHHRVDCVDNTTLFDLAHQLLDRCVALEDLEETAHHHGLYVIAALGDMMASCRSCAPVSVRAVAA